MALRRHVLTVVVGCTAFMMSAAVPSPVRAQFEPPPVDDSVDQKPDPKKDGPVEGSRSRRRRARSTPPRPAACGCSSSRPARTKAGAPTVGNVSGPPLDDREKVAHALNRLGFGPKPGEVDEVLQMGANAWEIWAGYQIDPSSIDDSEVESEMARRFLEDDVAPGDQEGVPDRRGLREQRPAPQRAAAVRPDARRDEPPRVQRADGRLLAQPLLRQPAPRERPGPLVDRARYEEHVVRKHAFGKFKNMLFASATHPAMLEYLDNAISRRTPGTRTTPAR